MVDGLKPSRAVDKLVGGYTVPYPLYYVILNFVYTRRVGSIGNGFGIHQVAPTC